MHPTTTRTRALLYGRKSVVRSGVDLVSVENQRAALALECERRGWVADWFEDADGHRTGRREDTRPAWLRLKSQIAAADVVAVMGYRLDRLSRSVRDTISLVEYCEAHGVHVITLDGQIDTSKHSGALATANISFLSTIAQLESDLARDRMRDLVASKAAKGISHGKPAFGFSRTGSASEVMVSPNADQMAVIRCLTLYASGLSYDEVGPKLNDEGLLFKTRAGHPKPWGREAVRTCVGNVLGYLGYFQPATSGWDAKASRVQLVGEGDHVERYARACGATVSEHITPMIDRELANAVIERRHVNQRTGRPTANWWPLLKGILYYGNRKCRSQIRAWGGRYETTRPAISIDADRLDGEILRWLAGVRFGPEMMAQIRANIQARLSPHRTAVLRERADKAAATKGLLLDLLKDGRIGRERYNSEYDAVDKEWRAAVKELESPAEVEQALALAERSFSLLALTTAERRNQAIRHVFERVEVDAEGAVVAIQLRGWALQALATVASTYECSNDAEGGSKGQSLSAPVAQLLAVSGWPQFAAASIT